MVVPPQAFVHAAVADLRSAPEEGSELVDQVHHREWLRVLGSRDAWHHVQAEDHYFGWIRGADVQVLSVTGGRRIAALLAPVHREADPRAEVIGQLPVGTPVPEAQKPEPPQGWVRALDGYVALADIAATRELPQRAPTGDDLVATAEAFLGVPYLWGGTTALGLDCSGLVQQVYRLNGIRLDRDADQQAMEGRGVDVPAAGDLVFFGEERITHVALATGERTFIHAPQSGGMVERGELPAPGRTVRAVRRYLP
jgi:gamma-D-glutamyl-L-lysine dipeptidyl-peptidase